jgi:hypothetical protein
MEKKSADLDASICLEQMDRFRLIFALFKRPSWRRFSTDPFIIKGAPDHNGSGRTPKPR